MLRVIRVLAPNPGPLTLDGTNTWVVGRDPAAVIDPGPDEPAHIRATLDEAGPVSGILLTHDHPDHADGAPRMAEAAGAPVLAFRQAPGRDRLTDGQEVSMGGGRLTALHTPGHSPDHVAFFSEEDGGLFTGDAVLGRGTSVIDPPDGDLTAYLRSLHRLLALPPRTLYPGHGPTVFDGVAKLEEYLEHRAEREEEVIDALRAGPRTPAQVAAAIYSNEPPELRAAASRSVLAHLLRLEREDRAVRSGTGEATRFELVATHPCERCGRPAMPRSRLCRSCGLGLLQEAPEEERPAEQEPREFTPPAGG